jgi:hypothetical protein
MQIRPAQLPTGNFGLAAAWHTNDHKLWLLQLSKYPAGGQLTEAE